MRYIIILLIFFIGCSKEEKKEIKQPPINIQPLKETNETNKSKSNEIIIHLDDIDLIFKDKKLIYPNERVILLFENDFRESDVLDMLKVKYYKTDNQFLKEYFNITIYPTIIVLDKNRTIRYENFTPYAILKEEGF